MNCERNHYDFFLIIFIFILLDNCTQQGNERHEEKHETLMSSRPVCKARLFSSGFYSRNAGAGDIRYEL